MKASSSRLSCFFLSFAAFACTVSAQPGLSLAEALQRAIDLNPLLKAAQSQVDVAKGQVVQAGLRPNPRATLQTEDIRPSTNELPFSFVNSTEDYVIVGQTLETGGKRARRVDAASAAVESNTIDAELTRLQLEARVSTAYWAAVIAARSYQLGQENLNTFEEDLQYTRNRVREGMTPEADLLRIELERDRAQGMVLTAKRASAQALLNLFRSMGTRDFKPVELTDSIEGKAAITMPKVEDAVQGRPEIKAARQAVTQAEANVRLQKANAKPDPEALVGYKRNVGYDTFYGALQIDLPIHNRNQGNVLSAKAQLTVAQERLRGVQNTVEAELHAAELAFQDQQEVLRLLAPTVPKAQEAERLARAAYREGGVDLLRLLDSEKSRIQVQSDFYRALAEYQQSAVALRVAAGEDLLRVTP